MENVDVQKLVKKKREGTFGATPQVDEVKPVKKEVVQAEVETKPPAAQKEVSNPLDKIKESVAKQKRAESPDKEPKDQIKLTKGFTVGVDSNGHARLIPFGNPNYLELVGLMRYTSKKESDILHDLAISKEAQMQLKLNKLAEDVSIVAEGVSVLLNE